jgi:hypothetical protein
MRKVSGRFLVKYKLPPLEEADDLWQMYQDFKYTFPTCLINEIQQFTFGKNDKTQLQLVYDPETKTVPNTHKQLFQDTCRFFTIKTPGQFRPWCYRKIKNGFRVSDSRIQIALENLRFRVATLAKQHNIEPMINKLPCQLKPCLADVIAFFGCTEPTRYATGADHPYLAGFLSSRKIDADLILSRASSRTGGYSAFGQFAESARVCWTPEDLVEFLHRLHPVFMDSPSSYALLAYIRHSPQKEDIEKALIKRLPTVDWKTVDFRTAHEVRCQLARAIGWNFGLSPSIMPFAAKVMAEIDAVHPDPYDSDDLLE